MAERFLRWMLSSSQLCGYECALVRRWASSCPSPDQYPVSCAGRTWSVNHIVLSSVLFLFLSSFYSSSVVRGPPSFLCLPLFPFRTHFLKNVCLIAARGLSADKWNVPIASIKRTLMSSLLNLMASFTKQYCPTLVLKIDTSPCYASFYVHRMIVTTENSHRTKLSKLVSLGYISFKCNVTSGHKKVVFFR